jgi:predicted dehydrogenase
MAQAANLRVGLIGAGNWADTAHLPAFTAQHNVEVVGITDRNPEHIRALSEKFSVPGYVNLEQMMAGVNLDVLDVVTSRGMHYEPVMAGMAQNLSILCEKPLGHHIVETRQIYREARKRELVTHMGFTFRYSPAVRYFRDLVQSGAVGEVYHIQGFEENGQLVDRNTPLPRIGFSRKTDSGALHGYGSHLLNLVRWTLGEFEQVIGDMATFIKERPVLGEDARLPVGVDDSTIVLGRMESGVQATMQFSKIAMGYAPGVEMRVFGSKAALWLRLEESPQGFEHLRIADLANRNFRPLSVPASYLEGHDFGIDWPQDYFTALVRHFVQRVREHDLTEGSSDFGDGLRAQELLEAIERSHSERRWVTIKEVMEE